VRSVERRLAAPLQALVFDVVVDQQSIVQEFDGHRRLQRLFERRAEGARGGDAQARAHHLAAARGIVGHEIVEPTRGRAARQIVGQQRAHARAVFVQPVANRMGRALAPHGQGGSTRG
jgi:hypothetical protein